MVRKRRLLYTVGGTRIHLDMVEGLGNFIELEFVEQLARPGEDGIKSVAEIRQRLDIRDEDLIAGAYIDLLTQPSHPDA